MAIEIEEPTLFENILHYGLFVGAIFQIICILAVIFIPKSESEQDSEEELKQGSNSAKKESIKTQVLPVMGQTDKVEDWSLIHPSDSFSALGLVV
uniref:Protein MANBAL n=1 Tax=Magallana gigas TaxID=29159 RepID=A0A8W8LVD8_MAGGI